METIHQHVSIPEDHRLNLEVRVPERVPAGPADLLVVISPRPSRDPKGDLLAHAGRLAGTPLAAKGGLAVQRELRDECPIPGE